MIEQHIPLFLVLHHDRKSWTNAEKLQVKYTSFTHFINIMS